jgi:hypothetical protein
MAAVSTDQRIARIAKLLDCKRSANYVLPLTI